MFRHARIKLTILYSVIFLLLFWTTSSGVYLWMNHYFGDRRTHPHATNERQLEESNSDKIMDELRNVLLLLDLSLFFLVPTITWILTGKTLEPVQKAHEREKEFLTNASHDLRTPLTIMRTEMELALRKNRSTNEYKHTLLSSKEEVEDLIGLVENLLFIARSENTQAKNIFETIDLTDLITERIVSFQRILKKKQQKLLFDPPSESLTIQGSLPLLKRLFTNLVDNASKYTPSEGTIRITAKKKQQTVIVEISDTGVGISSEHQEHLFERFYRVDSSRNEKGYGLGLAIAQQIVFAHRGKIGIRSKLGKGTTVTLTFPSK